MIALLRPAVERGVASATKSGWTPAQEGDTR
jgi:hypothetical protein